MELDAADLRTETFTNSQGWTLVKVTHLPTSISVERTRESDRHSPVQAQSECVAEIKRLVAEGRSGSGEAADADADAGAGAPVSRAEFEALVARVADLERALREEGRSG